MKESERLKAAKELISTPDKWMQGDYSEYGEEVWDGCKFCALGAVRRAYYEDEGYYSTADLSPEVEYLEKALATFYPLVGEVHKFNDSHTHTEVMLMFDAAIALAEAEGN